MRAAAGKGKAGERGFGRESRLNAAILLFVVLVSFGFQGLYFRHGLNNLVDLGVACVDAERILQGQVPGRDFFEPYGPGRFYLTAWVFQLAGPSLLAFSALCLVLSCLKSLLVYLVSSMFLPRPWALLSTALAMLVHGPLHKVFLLLAALLVLYPALLLVRRPSRGRAFLLGLGVVAAGLLRYDVGAMGLLVAGLAISMVRRAWTEKADAPSMKELGPGFLGGLALAGLPCAVLLFGIADTAAFFQHHWIRLESLEAARKSMPGFFSLFAGTLEDRLFAGLAVVLAAAPAVVLGIAWRRWKIGGAARREALQLLLLCLVGALLFNQVRLGPKFPRLAQVAPPLFLALLFLLRELSLAIGKHRRISSLRFIGPAAGAGLLIGLAGYLYAFGGDSSQDSFAVLRREEYYLDHPRGGVFMRGHKGREIEIVLACLDSILPAGEAFYSGPACPLFNFLANRPYPAPFTDFSFYNFSTENQRLVIRSLESAKIRYAVDWPRMVTGFDFTLSMPFLMEYLDNSFRIIHRTARFAVMERRR